MVIYLGGKDTPLKSKSEEIRPMDEEWTNLLRCPLIRSFFPWQTEEYWIVVDVSWREMAIRISFYP